MKTKVLILLIVVLAVFVAVLVARSPGESVTKKAAVSTVPKKDSHAHDHPHPHKPGRIPAYEKEPSSLAPTMAPSQFIGKTREAYRVAKEIPETLAQLPCYCHCDQSFGHRSLHTCFEDDHAAQCAVCVDEALLAYRLQKEQGLSAAQIREVIIEKYSANH